jgi:uncharacterized cupin superfamily protein
MAEPTRGRLRGVDTAPATGEESWRVATLAGVTVEQILSGRLAAPVDYLADDDEWVVLLAGRAVLEVTGATLELRAGDWVMLPARTPHRLLETDPGTNWLTVTGRP